MNKILASGIIFVAGVACGLVLTYGTLHAQNSTGEGDVMAKLNEIAKGQEEVVAMVNSMKEDIQVIRVRVTQMQ